MKFFKIAMAVGLLFAVNMNADAQFGKLKGLANKAKEAVTGEGTTTTTDPVTDVTNSVSGESSNSGSSWTSPEVKENNGAKAAGGLDKYLGMTDADDQLVYSYYQPGSSDFRTDGKYDCAKTYGNSISQKIVEIYRYIKSDGKLGNVNPEMLRDFYYGKPKGAAVVTGVPELNDLLEHAMNPRSKYNSMRKGEVNVLMSKADAEAFKRSAEKAKKAYEAKYGAIPKA